MTIQRILEERARLLARPLAAEPRGQTIDLVTLSLGAERYGIDILKVQEIQDFRSLTPIPGVSAHWAGLVNLRGRIYPVLDLQRYLSLPAAQTSASRGQIILVTAAGLTVGLLVDDVVEVRRVLVEEIKPPLLDAQAHARDAIRGVTSDWVSVLDLDKLLASEGGRMKAEG